MKFERDELLGLDTGELIEIAMDTGCMRAEFRGDCYHVTMGRGTIASFDAFAFDGPDFTGDAEADREALAAAVETTLDDAVESGMRLPDDQLYNYRLLLVNAISDGSPVEHEEASRYLTTLEQLEEVAGKDVVRHALARALEGQGTSPWMRADEIEERLGRGEEVWLDAGWYLGDRDLLDSVPRMLAEAVDTEALLQNLGTDAVAPDALAAHCINHLAYRLEGEFEPIDFQNLRDVTRAFSENVRSSCDGLPCLEEVDSLLLDPDLDEEVRERAGCWLNLDAAGLAETATFEASVTLASKRGCERESALLDSVLQWQEDNHEWRDGELVAAEPLPPYVRPDDVGPSAIDWLCESQGTSLEDVVNGTACGPFAESMREELLESGTCASWPCVCVMGSMSFEQWVATAACAESATRLEGCAFVADDSCLVGIYDPVVGAGGLMGVRLERPIEVPAAMVRDCMEEPERGGKTQGLWTPQECFGFCEPFAGRVGDAPEGMKARVSARGERVEASRP